MVGDDPVDLLGHHPVEAAQSRLHVRDGDPELGGGESAGSVEFVSPYTSTQSGTREIRKALDPGEHRRGLLPVRPEPIPRLKSGSGISSSSKNTFDMLSS